MDKQGARRAQIEAAAFEVLEEVGYKKASMLQIAKRAKASNETLYAWYGNKQALFSALIETNAKSVHDILEAAISGQSDLGTALDRAARLLLQFTATEKAIIVNRAAVTDALETGILAKAIEQNARQVMYRLLGDLMAKLEASQVYEFDGGTEQAVSVFSNLLIGELQMQQSLGSVSPLTPDDIDTRSKQACHLFDRLYLAR